MTKRVKKERNRKDMKYSYRNDINLVVEPMEFDKNSGKEVLQYAVGGLLYMPASNAKIAKKIISREYDFVKSMVLDLEDALGDDLVGFGQRSICNTIAELAAAVETGKMSLRDVPLIFVRVREPKHISDTYEMLKDNIKYITGFNIPKFDKNNCDQFIREFKEVADTVKKDYQSDLYMMPIIENKNTIYRQLRMENLLYMNDKLRAISDNVLNIRVGGADFCSVYGIRRSVHDDIYDIGVVRSVLNDIVNVFGKNYIVSGPVWEYFDAKDGNTAWADGLRKELYADRLNGMHGKTSIHPSQLPIIQESLIVDEMDYNDAVSIIGMNANTTGVKKSVGGNRMNEVKTHTNWAKKTLGLALVYGVRKASD